MTPSIYLITNKENNKVYVGASVNPSKRWYNHRWNCIANQYPKLPIYRAMKKYGIDSFSFEVIEVFDTEELMLEAETWWISYLKSLGVQLYNVTAGGEAPPMFGKHHSEESKRK